MGWSARYRKEVDAEETTLRFWQEIYDGQGRLVERHEKYPMDKGHEKSEVKIEFMDGDHAPCFALNPNHRMAIYGRQRAPLAFIVN